MAVAPVVAAAAAVAVPAAAADGRHAAAPLTAAQVGYRTDQKHHPATSWGAFKAENPLADDHIPFSFLLSCLSALWVAICNAPCLAQCLGCQQVH